MDIIFQNTLIPFSILLFAVVGYLLGNVDLSGAISGIILALIIWIGGGLESIVSLFLFFVIGSYATSWKKESKSRHNTDLGHDVQRNIYNVLGNGGVAGILSLTAILTPEYQPIIILMYITSFVTACSDKLSSELGIDYGKRYYHIMTFRSSQRGLDGVISKEGTYFGLVGSFLIATGTFFFYNDLKTGVIITLSIFIGNIADSWVAHCNQKDT